MVLGNVFILKYLLTHACALICLVKVFPSFFHPYDSKFTQAQHTCNINTPEVEAICYPLSKVGHHLPIGQGTYTN